MSVASEAAPVTGCRLRGGSSASVSASASASHVSAQPPSPHPLQRPRPCRLCWYCCCSCSCLAVRSEEEHKDSKNDSVPQASLEEIRSWGHSFDQLMSSPAGRDVFLEYLRSEYNEENILFWLACEELKKEGNQSEVEEKARSIYEEFISILSPKEVSLDAQVRDQVEKGMKTPTPHTFDEAQQQIYTLMHRDPYKRFIKSQLFLTRAQITNADGISDASGAPPT